MTGARALVAAAALAGLTGCYTYVPLETGEVAPGAAVRAHLAEPRDLALEDRTLPVVERVDGELVRLEDDTLVVWARVFESDEGVRRLSWGQPVSLSRRSLRMLEWRQLSTARTAVFVGLAAVALYAIDRGIDSWGGSSEGGSGTPNPQ